MKQISQSFSKSNKNKQLWKIRLQDLQITSPFKMPAKNWVFKEEIAERSMNPLCRNITQSDVIC